MKQPLLVLTSHRPADVAIHFSNLGIIVRDLPIEENDFARMGICGKTISGFVLLYPSRMPTEAEVMYILSRIRKVEVKDK